MPSTHPASRGPFQKTNRSAFTNFLRAKYEMYAGATAVRSYPHVLTVESSDVCQLRCPTCVTGIENEMRRRRTGEIPVFRHDRAKLTTDLYRALLDEMGEYLFLVLFYNFGEPLLNPRLPELLRMTKALDIETDVNTNLSVPLTDAQIDELLETGLDYLMVSLDGFTQETYERHRVGGNIALAKDNLERLARARDRLGLPTVITYNFLVFSFNEHEVGQARQYCDDLGINFNPRDAFIHDPDWLPSYRLNEQPQALQPDFQLPPDFSHYEDGVAKFWTPFPQIHTEAPARCGWHYGYSVVSAGGKVAPCCGIPKDEHDFGQMGPGRGRFADVWNSDEVQGVRAFFAGEDVAGRPGGDHLCVRCPLPQLFLHLYSLHDFKVLRQFMLVMGDADPKLRAGFDQFAKARYGQTMDEMFQEGFVPPPLFGTDNREESKRFVEFFERELADLPAAIDVTARRDHPYLRMANPTA